MKRKEYKIEKDANCNRFYIHVDYHGKTYRYYRYTRSVWAAIAQVNRFHWCEDRNIKVDPYNGGWEIIRNY